MRAEYREEGVEFYATPEVVRKRETLLRNRGARFDKPVILVCGDTSLYCEGFPYTAKEGTVTFNGYGKEALTTDQAVRIGNGDGDDIQLDDAHADSPHAVVDPRKEGFYVADLDSEQGTLVKIVQDVPARRKRILPGESIPFVWKSDRKNELLLGQQQYTLSKGANNDLCIEDENGVVESFSPDEVGNIQCNIGRGQLNDISSSQASVSRHHATLRVIGGKVLEVSDLNSANGTFIQEHGKKLEQQHELKRLIEEWSNALHRNGKVVLTHAEQMAERFEFESVTGGHVEIFYPRGAPRKNVAALVPYAQKVEELIREQYVARQEKHPIKALLVPGNMYCERACAHHTNFIMDGLKHREGTFAHEYVHAYLYALYGRSAVDVLIEGAALYFGSQAAPHDVSAYDVRRHYGYDDVIKLYKEGKPVGLSHTATLRAAGKKLSTPEEYERAYRFGYFFTKYFIKTYDQQAYLTLYKNSCAQDMWDFEHQADVMKEAIRRTAKELNMPDLTPEKVMAEFDLFYKLRAK